MWRFYMEDLYGKYHHYDSESLYSESILSEFEVRDHQRDTRQETSQRIIQGFFDKTIL